MTDNQKCQPDQQITSIADAVVKLKELRESNKNLNEPDIEERFARLALAFKTDKFTLNKRLDLQKRQRDVAEKNIETELDSLRESLNTLHRIDQLCSESDMRDIITKMQQHVDIIQRATLRMSNKAETYGAVQQEERLNCAFETMLNYVEHLKLLYDKEHLELEEYRRLLAEHNLLPGEKGSSLDDDSKRALPPRSHSLSSTSKPESRTRLLSSVCLLNNNNYEAPRLSSNGSSAQPGSVSPKSRRSSLPAGPTSSHTSTPLRTHNSIHEIKETKMEGKESQTKSDEKELQKTDEAKEEEKDASAIMEKSCGENVDDKDMN